MTLHSNGMVASVTLVTGNSEDTVYVGAGHGVGSEDTLREVYAEAGNHSTVYHKGSQGHPL